MVIELRIMKFEASMVGYRVQYVEPKLTNLASKLQDNSHRK